MIPSSFVSPAASVALVEVDPVRILTIQLRHAGATLRGYKCTINSSDRASSSSSSSSSV
jgi:hypothetical protein